jgi:hypothetical protein
MKSSAGGVAGGATSRRPVTRQRHHQRCHIDRRLHLRLGPFKAKGEQDVTPPGKRTFRLSRSVFHRLLTTHG